MEGLRQQVFAHNCGGRKLAVTGPRVKTAVCYNFICSIFKLFQGVSMLMKKSYVKSILTQIYPRQRNNLGFLYFAIQILSILKIFRV